MKRLLLVFSILMFFSMARSQTASNVISYNTDNDRIVVGYDLSGGSSAESSGIVSRATASGAGGTQPEPKRKLFGRKTNLDIFLDTRYKKIDDSTFNDALSSPLLAVGVGVALRYGLNWRATLGYETSSIDTESGPGAVIGASKKNFYYWDVGAEYVINIGEKSELPIGLRFCQDILMFEVSDVKSDRSATIVNNTGLGTVGLRRGLSGFVIETLFLKSFGGSHYDYWGLSLNLGLRWGK